MSTSEATAEQDRLRSHFATHAPSAHGQQWNSLWADGSFLPWDRGEPAPALIDLLEQRIDLVGTAFVAPGQNHDVGENRREESSATAQSSRRRRVLIPGCGRGYECYLLAARGWNVTGMDISEVAVERAREFGKTVGDGGVFKVGPEGKGSARFVVGDFFKIHEQDEDLVGEVDLIWDYTFLCALPLELRPKWSRQMARLLSPTGRMICLEFPTHKDPKAGGPPWALPPQTYVALLSRPGDEVKYGEDGVVLSEEKQGPVNDHALERLVHFKPERTFGAGKDTDWVSVWKKR